MARSRESAIKKAVSALAIARDQDGKPEGQTAQARADAIVSEYGITVDEIRAAEKAIYGDRERRRVFWRAVTLYPGFDGGPAPWQVALAQWAAARYGGGGGFVGKQPCVLAYEDGAPLDKAVVALRTASEALIAAYGQVQQASRVGLPPLAAPLRGMGGVNLSQDVVGWIFVCLLAGYDEPPAPPEPPVTPPPAHADAAAGQPSSAGSTKAPSSARPAPASTTALATRPPPWAKGARPDACEDIGAAPPEVPLQVPGMLIDVLTMTVMRVLGCLPVR